MMNYDYYDDGGLTAAFGKVQRKRQEQSQFYRDLREDILTEAKKLIEQTIDIQIKNEASPALKELKKDLQNLGKQ